MTGATGQKSKRRWRSRRPPARYDPLREVRRRILVTAALGETITYSELLDGISFDGSWSRTGEPFTVNARKWTIRYMQVLAVLLAEISEPILDRHGFLISALVVNKLTRKPGNGFFRTAKAAGLLVGDEDRDLVWEDQLAAAYAHCDRIAEDDQH